MEQFPSLRESDVVCYVLSLAVAGPLMVVQVELHCLAFLMVFKLGMKNKVSTSCNLTHPTPEWR